MSDEQVNRADPETEEEFARYAELNRAKVAQLGLSPADQDWEISEQEITDLRRQVALEEHEEDIDRRPRRPLYEIP